MCRKSLWVKWEETTNGTPSTPAVGQSLETLWGSLEQLRSDISMRLERSALGCFQVEVSISLF